MSTTAIPNQAAASDASVAKVDMKLEVVVIPVSAAEVGERNPPMRQEGQ